MDCRKFDVNQQHLDLMKFERSEEYKSLMRKIPLSMTFGDFYNGLPIEIKGDLEKIIIHSKNEISLVILYDLYGNDKQYVQVKYESLENTKFIRESLLPMTSITLMANYTDKFKTFIGGNIELFNQPLIYGHYICQNCGYDYGITKVCEGRYCEICIGETTDKLKYVDDYYKINT